MKKRLVFIIFLLSLIFSCNLGSEPHEHTYSDEWTSDETYHWHNANCEHIEEKRDETKHSFGEYVSNNDATANVDGTKSRTCTICNYEDKVTDEGTKLHVHSWDEGVVTTVPGCETTGVKTYTCTCGETKTETIPAEHSFGEYVSNNDATTEADGTKTRTCRICNYEDKVIDEGTKLHVHSWDDGVVTTLPRCETTGVKTYTCTCGEIKTETIPSTGHFFNENFVCSCGEVKELTTEEFLSAIGTSVTVITADSSILGITKLENGTIVNVYGVKISGEFSFTNHFPPKLEMADLKGLNTSKVINMSYMFTECRSMKTLNLSSFDTSRVTDMNNMFNHCDSLTSLDLSSFTTSKVTSMASMFYHCESLKTLNLSSFDTSKVTGMNSMFGYCRSLTSLELSSFNTSNVIDMNSMFGNCGSLENLNLRTFDTSEVTAMFFMFCNCVSLTSLDLSRFNTSKVSSMNSMFYNCENLKTLDISRFDTLKVENMTHMFSNCRSLKTLDLTNFNTSIVINMESMFSSCINLTTIYATNSFIITSVISGDDMFIGCENLSGAISYDSFKTSLDYANTITGYFTVKE